MTDLNRSPGTAPITVVQGDSFSESLTFKQPTVLNLTTYTFLAQVRRERDAASELLATFSVGTASAATGVITLSLTATQTAGMDPGRYWWELQWTVGSSVRTGVSGEFVVLPQVAKS